LEVTTARMSGGARLLHAAWLPRSQSARHDDNEVLLSVFKPLDLHVRYP
jgi:hypothetical protein